MTTSHLDIAGLKLPLTVLYDGSSKISGRELKELKSRDKEGSLQLVDISGGGAAAHGLSGPLGNDVYVRDAAGRGYVGATALEAVNEAVGLGNYFRFTRLPSYDCTPGRLRGGA